MAKLVSKTYGEALFELASEENKTQEMMEEVQAVNDLLAENPDFEKLMLHPGIPKQEKVQIMEEVFRNRVSSELTGFLKIVIIKERYRELSAIFEYFINKVKELQRIGVAHVATAVELTEAQKAEVCSSLVAKSGYESMEMHYSIDPSLIGGMVIRINDRVVDSSIRTKLNDLTKQLLNIQLG